MRRDKRIFLVGALTCLVIAAEPAVPVLAQAANGDKAAATAPKTLSGNEVYDQRKGCIYTVETDRAQGTGFAVGPFVYTCYHVVAGAREISLTREGSPPVSVKRVIAADRDADIAVLVPESSLGGSGRPAEDIGSSAAVGDPLYVIGTPKGLENTFTEGVLSGRRTVGKEEYIQLSAPVSPGSSGSPVFDKYGKIAGMVVAQLKDAQQLNFAISAATLKSVPLGIPISCALREGDDESTSQQPSDTKMVGSNKAEVLKGLKGVYVLVEDLDDGAIQAGLDKDDLQTNVELRLRESDVKVLSEEESLKTLGSPLLYLHVMILKEGDENIYAWNVDLSVEENMRLERDQKTLVASATTWETGGTGYAGSLVVKDAVRNAVRDYVNKFLNDYLKANPKTSQGTDTMP